MGKVIAINIIDLELLNHVLVIRLCKFSVVCVLLNLWPFNFEIIGEVPYEF